MKTLVYAFVNSRPVTRTFYGGGGGFVSRGVGTFWRGSGDEVFQKLTVFFRFRPKIFR